ncbi:TPA: hypothetical protein HA265_00525 [Candidatus Woesearchaeota archaeon]|nr:hypothetical protein [Candidatus Woesearchaeota archaeon]
MPINKKEDAKKKIFSALAVAFFGFILLNITFFLLFLYHKLIDSITQASIQPDMNMAFDWYPLAKYLGFLIIIGTMTYKVFRSKLKTIYKAIYLTVPLAVMYATTGMYLHRWPVAVYTIGTISTAGILYWFYRTKQPWIYHYTLILMATVMFLITVLGVEI